MRTFIYFSIGILFGVVLFHMYGVIGSAVFCGALSLFLIKKFQLKSILDGEKIRIAPKQNVWKRYLFGGVLFGLGWALAGACPGPMFTLLGAGFLPVLLILFSALLGTYCYGLIRDKLPH